MKSIKGATTSIHGKTVIKSTIVPCIAYKDYVEYIEEYKTPLKAEEIEVYKNGYITRMYQSKEADIIYKIKEKNIFILIEHQSTVDRLMPYRILNYSVAIMNQAVEKNKMKRKDYKYPKVIAIVLYTGREKWKAK